VRCVVHIQNKYCILSEMDGKLVFEDSQDPQKSVGKLTRKEWEEAIRYYGNSKDHETLQDGIDYLKSFAHQFDGDISHDCDV